MKFIKIFVFVLILKCLVFAERKNFAVSVGINTLQLKCILTQKTYISGNFCYADGILIFGIRGTRILKDYTKTNFYLSAELNKLYFYTEGIRGNGFMMNIPFGFEYFIGKKYSISNELSVVGSYIETEVIKVSHTGLNFMYNIFLNFYF